MPSVFESNQTLTTPEYSNPYSEMAFKYVNKAFDKLGIASSRKLNTEIANRDYNYSVYANGLDRQLEQEKHRDKVLMDAGKLLYQRDTLKYDKEFNSEVEANKAARDLRTDTHYKELLEVRKTEADARTTIYRDSRKYKGNEKSEAMFKAASELAGSNTMEELNSQYLRASGTGDLASAKVYKYALKVKEGNHPNEVMDKKYQKNLAYKNKEKFRKDTALAGIRAGHAPLMQRDTFKKTDK